MSCKMTSSAYLTGHKPISALLYCKIPAVLEDVTFFVITCGTTYCCEMQAVCLFFCAGVGSDVRGEGSGKRGCGRRGRMEDVAINTEPDRETEREDIEPGKQKGNVT